jgi:hypothetical protein
LFIDPRRLAGELLWPSPGSVSSGIVATVEWIVSRAGGSIGRIEDPLLGDRLALGFEMAAICTQAVRVAVMLQPRQPRSTRCCSR